MWATGDEGLVLAIRTKYWLGTDHGSRGGSPIANSQWPIADDEPPQRAERRTNRGDSVDRDAAVREFVDAAPGRLSPVHAGRSHRLRRREACALPQRRDRPRPPARSPRRQAAA